MKRILLSTFSLAALITVACLWQQNANLDREKQRELAEYQERQAEYLEEEAREAAGASDFLSRRRINPQTGTIDAKDVLKARQQTMEQIAAKADEVDLQWQNLGPNNVGGRTRDLLIDRSNDNHLITGGVAGGLFVSNDRGATWTDHPQNQTLESLSIACITQDPSNPNIIYVGTGEGFYYFSGEGVQGIPGEGILKSTDGGTTFAWLPATRPADSNDAGDEWAAVNSIAVHSNGNIYAALGAEGQSSGGLKVSTDGGTTWESAEGVIGGTGFDVAIGSDGTVHALVGSSYYRSADGNPLVFENHTSPTPGNFTPNNNRKVLAVAPTNPNVLYAALTKGNSCLDRVLRSEDKGNTWYEIGVGTATAGTAGSQNPGAFDPTAQPFGGSYCQGGYDLALGVSSTNPDQIYLGGITLWTWKAAGGWEQVDNIFESIFAPNYVHADKHRIIFNPENGDEMYVVCDGGVFRSNNAASDNPTFEPLNKGYNVTQNYSIAADLEGRVICGNQDNGTQYVPYQGLNSQLAATEVSGGDGGYVDIARTKPGVMFAATPEGALKRSTNGGNSFGLFFDENIDCEPRNSNQECTGDGILDGGGEFITPFVLWEDIDQYLQDGLPHAMYVTGSGETGSNDGVVWLTKNVLDLGTVPHWERGGQFSGSSQVVSCVGVSKTANSIYAGSTSGKLLRVKITASGYTDDEFQSSILPNSNNGRYVTAVAFAPTSSASTLYVTLGNYGYDHYVYRSTNSQAANPTFTSIQSNLPKMPVYDIVVDKDDPTRVFAATEMGVWMYNTATELWTPQNTGLGMVPVFRIRQEPMHNTLCNVLYVGTHGRGMYRSTTLTRSNCSTELPDWSVTGTETPTSQQPNFVLTGIPMRDAATAQITLPRNANASLSIFDLQGRRIVQQNLGKRTAGLHSIAIERGQMSAGTYIVVLEADGQRAAQKMIVQ